MTGVRKRRNQEIHWQGASIPEESLVSSIPENAIALMLRVVSRTSLSANTGSVREGVLAERITHIRHMSILTVEKKPASNHSVRNQPIGDYETQFEKLGFTHAYVLRNDIGLIYGAVLLFVCLNLYLL